MKIGFEPLGEIGQVFEAAFLTDMPYAFFRGDQQLFGIFQPEPIQIAFEAHLHFFFEQGTASEMRRFFFWCHK